MKKIVIMTFAGIMACSVAFAQSITLTNTFGGNADSTGGCDFITFTQHDDDSDYSNNNATVSDRVQLDFSSAKLDGRLRTELSTSSLNGKNAAVRFRGYMCYRPVEQLGFAVGNDFFTKYAVDAAYFAAADDTPKFGRMAESGAAMIGEAAGVRLLANIDGDSLFDDKDSFKLNFGAQYIAKNLFSVGAVFKSVTNDNLSTGIFVGLKKVKNLILNVGFIFNATDTDFIPAKSKYVASVSAGYKLESIPLGLYADFVTGLNNEYLEKGNTEKYNNENDENIVPMQARTLIRYNVTESLSLNSDVKIVAFAGNDSVLTTFYPYAKINISKFGTIDVGLRMKFDSDVGLAKFSIPLAWKYKFIEKK